MSYIYNELTTEQKCAVLGFARGFCGCIKKSSPMQLAELEKQFANIGEELGVSKEEVEHFCKKMEVSGRLEYAKKILNTLENKRVYGLFYPFFYNIVATLNSPEGLTMLDKIYNDEFGFDDAEIKNIWDLYEIKDFRKNNPIDIRASYCASFAILGEITTAFRDVDENIDESVAYNLPPTGYSGSYFEYRVLYQQTKSYRD